MLTCNACLPLRLGWPMRCFSYFDRKASFTGQKTVPEAGFSMCRENTDDFFWG